MRRLLHLRWLAVLAAAICTPLFAAPPEEAPPRQAAAGKDKSTAFLRLSRDEQGQLRSLDTAVVRCVPADGRPGATVDLVAVVHVGEAEYYEALNRLFRQYDSVLFELIAPRGTRIPKDHARRSATTLSTIQRVIKDVLELEFQLDQVDYTPENFVHADMSPEELAASMAQRDESFMKLYLRAMSISMQQQQQGKGVSNLDLLRALFSKDRSMALKRLMAQQFENLDAMMAGIEGKDGTTIITQRNKVALEVLAERLEAGDRHIAIFYGAGHMPDMERRLEKDFGLKRKSERWLTAWDLSPTKKPDNQDEEE